MLKLAGGISPGESAPLLTPTTAITLAPSHDWQGIPSCKLLAAPSASESATARTLLVRAGRLSPLAWSPLLYFLQSFPSLP